MGMAFEKDDKYAHLLQPIRDLASNWNINIANELEEYLEVLEGITFSFQGGQTLNFAEAALVIQGSACVYSKKVEYLHSLVYQALEFVAERKVKAVRSKGLADAGAEDEFDDEERFLSLDDTLEEGTGIDLEEDDGPQDEPLPTRLPATLLALEDNGLGEGDGEAGNYRIASCAVHHSGALLLEARDGFFLDEHLRPFTRPTETLPPAPQADSRGSAGATEPEMEAQLAMEDDYFDDGGADAGYFGPDDNEFDQPMDAAGPPLHQSPAPWGGPRAPQAQIPPELAEEELYDPYAPLDPSDGGSMAVKPYKKMVRIPKQPRMRVQKDLPPQALTDGLLTLPAPSTGLLFPEFSYALQHAQQEDAKQARRNGRGGVSSATGRHAQAQLNSSVFTLAEAQAANAVAEEEHDDAEDNSFDPGFDDYDYGPVDDGGGAGFDDFDDMAVAAAAEAGGHGGWARGGPLTDAAAGPSDGGDISYEDLCRAHVDSLIAAAAAAEVQTELAARVSTWRSKMAPMLEEEDARPDFDIHVYGERILDGLASLTVSGPIIEEKDAKEQPAADNNETMAQETTAGPVHFEEVVVNAHTAHGYDVPRVFSSMLQLVNNGNLQITKIDDSPDNFTITLLSTELKHKRIGDYRAPSALEADGAGPSVLVDTNREESAAALPEEARKGKAPATAKASKRRKA